MKEQATKEAVDQLIRLWVLIHCDHQRFAFEYSHAVAQENGVSLIQNPFESAVLETRRYPGKHYFTDGNGQKVKSLDDYHYTATATATRNRGHSRLPKLFLKKSSTTLERLYYINNAMNAFTDDYRQTIMIHYIDNDRKQRETAKMLGFNLRKVERAIESARAVAARCFTSE